MQVSREEYAMRRQLYLGVCVAMCAIGRPAIAEQVHGYLGVTVGIDKEGERGPTVQDVFPDTPAAKAGLRDGDWITTVGDQETRDVEGFLKAVASHRPGEQVTLTIRRGNRRVTTTATLGEGPANGSARRLEETSPTPGQGSAYLGISIKPLTPEMQRQARIGVEGGIYIIDVLPNSPADVAGLEPGDVIYGAGGKLVRSPEELRYMVQQTATGKELPITVIRGNEKLTYKPVPQAGLVSYYRTPVPLRPVLESGPPLDPARVRELEDRVVQLERQLRDERRK